MSLLLDALKQAGPPQAGPPQTDMDVISLTDKENAQYPVTSGWRYSKRWALGIALSVIVLLFLGVLAYEQYSNHQNQLQGLQKAGLSERQLNSLTRQAETTMPAANLSDFDLANGNLVNSTLVESVDPFNPETTDESVIEPRVETVVVPNVTTQPLTTEAGPNALSSGNQREEALASETPQDSKPVEALPVEALPTNTTVILDRDQQYQLSQQAHAAYQQQDLQRARELYQQLIAANPDQVDALRGLAAISIAQQDPQARYFLQRLAQADPQDTLVQQYASNGTDLQAAQSLIDAVQRQPDYAPYQAALADYYAQRQQWPAAQQAYFNAMQLAPEVADYAFNLAVSLEHINQPAAAVTYYQKALQATRQYSTAFDEQTIRRRLQTLSADKAMTDGN